MTWTKKKDKPEDREFWSHVESVAVRVRDSEVYKNHRVAKKDASATDRRDDGARSGRCTAELSSK